MEGKKEQIMDPPPFPSGNLLEVMAEIEGLVASAPLSAKMDVSDEDDTQGEASAPEQSFADDFNVETDGFVVFDSANMDPQTDNGAYLDRSDRRQQSSRFWNAQRGDNLLNLALQLGVKGVQKGEEIIIPAGSGTSNAPITLGDDDEEEEESPVKTHTSPKVIVEENRCLADAERWLNLACQGMHKNVNMSGPFEPAVEKMKAGEGGEPYQWDRMAQTLMPRDFRLPEASRDYSMTSDNLVKHLFQQRVLKRWNVRSQWDKDLERLGLQFYRLATLQSIAIEALSKAVDKVVKKVATEETDGEKPDADNPAFAVKKLLSDLDALVTFGVNRSVVLKSYTNRKSRNIFLDSVNMPKKLKDALIEAPCLSYDLFHNLSGIVGDFYNKPPTQLEKGRFDFSGGELSSQPPAPALMIPRPPAPRPMAPPMRRDPPPPRREPPPPPPSRRGPPAPQRGGRGLGGPPRGMQNRPTPLMSTTFQPPSRGGSARGGRGQGRPAPGGPRGGGPSRPTGPSSRGGPKLMPAPGRQNQSRGGTWRTYSGEQWSAPQENDDWDDNPSGPVADFRSGNRQQWAGDRRGPAPSWNNQGPSKQSFGNNQNFSNPGNSGGGSWNQARPAQSFGGSQGESNPWDNEGVASWADDQPRFSQNDNSDNFDEQSYQRGGVEWRPLPPPPPPPPIGAQMGGPRKTLLGNQFGPGRGPAQAGGPAPLNYGEVSGFGGNALAEDRGVKRKNEFEDAVSAFLRSQGPGMLPGWQNQNPF